MATLIASDFGGIYWFSLLVYGAVACGGLLFVVIVGGCIYSSIKNRRR